MAKEIKQKIVLEGEKQYNQAIREAQRNLKTLKSELKAETAELGKNATEQQKSEARAKSLRKQIAEQEKVVKTLRQALQDAKEQYGDNADVVQKWEQRLNDARTTLGNMKSDLDELGTGFKTLSTDAAAATVATKSVADALGTIGSAGDSVADAIENIFTSMIETVTGAVEKLWDLITETAGKANNWTDLASYYGSTAQEIQMWSQSIQAAGGDFEKFQGIVNRLAFGGNEAKITELIGVSKENYQDDVKYTLAVLDELQRRKESLGQGWYDDVMSQLFGARKSADVSWFLANANGHTGANGEWINGWRDNPERFNGDQGGYGMSSEELGTMNDLYIKIQEIETKWDAVKRKFAAGFGMVSLNLLVNVEGTLDGIADYMNAKDDSEKQAALDKIRTNVEEFFTKLGEIIRDCIHIIRDVGLDLSESDDPLTAAIGDILVKLSDALQWMVDNADKVKHAFEVIFGAWLLAKLAAVAGKLSGILMQIEAIKAFKGLGGAGAEKAAETTAEAVAKGVGLKFSASSLASMAVPAAVLAAGVLPAILAQKSDEAKWISDYETANAVADAAEASGMEADLLRQLNEAGGVKVNEDGTYQRNFLGFLNMNPTDQANEILESLNDPEKRESIYNDIMRYGPMNGAGDRATSTGNYAWNELLRFWGEGDGEELDYYRIDALIEYLRETEINKLTSGDLITDATDRVIEAIDENLDGSGRLPDEWYTTTTGAGAGVTNESGVTDRSLDGLKELPAGMETASERGIRRGISGLRVEIDGQTAGRILAPYVSQEIAKDIQ